MHDRFLQHYRARKFDRAESDLHLLRDIAPVELKPLYAMFASRLVYLRANPPAQDWYGTYTAEHK